MLVKKKERSQINNLSFYSNRPPPFPKGKVNPKQAEGRNNNEINEIENFTSTKKINKIDTSQARLTKINRGKEMKQVMSRQILNPLKIKEYYEKLHNHEFVS